MDRLKLTHHLNQYLAVDNFRDHCPNGLQVEGKSSVKRVVLGVTACQALIDAAIAQNADGIIVHHGLFWKGDEQAVVGYHKNRLQALLENGINLWGYHLPLDCHPELGNNAELAKRLAFENIQSFSVDGVENLLWLSSGIKPISIEHLIQKIVSQLDQRPVYLGNQLSGSVTKIAWCTGAAQKYIVEAKKLGAELFISGEASEQTFHLARELDIHYLACGHHATERYGVQSLGQYIQQQFDIEVEYIDIPNPI